jgi:hypothetical protein
MAKQNSNKKAAPHTFTKQDEKVYTSVSVCQKVHSNRFLRQQRSADGDTHGKSDTVSSEVYCEILKKLRKAIQDEKLGMLTYGIVLLHDNARPHTGTVSLTQTHLEHFISDLSNHLLTVLILLRTTITCLST